MTIPTQVTTDLANLQKQLLAAQPLSSAGPATLRAIQLNAVQLLDDIFDALGLDPSDLITSTVGNLDDPLMPIDPSLMPGILLTLVDNANDQASLATAYGYIGRSLINLNLLIGQPTVPVAVPIPSTATFPPPIMLPQLTDDSGNVILTDDQGVPLLGA